MILPCLTIANSGKKGRGVFTTADLSTGTIIEISPIIELSVKDRKIIEGSRLHDYIFEWGPTHRKGCLALGYISLYNHSYNSNCDYEMDFQHQTMTITTVRPVKAGEELSINYNAVPDDDTKVWFDVHD
jgi:SET domain-containing protein